MTTLEAIASANRLPKGRPSCWEIEAERLPLAWKEVVARQARRRRNRWRRMWRWAWR